MYIHRRAQDAVATRRQAVPRPLPAPSTRAPWGSRAARSLHPLTPRTRPGWTGDSRGSSAARAALRAPTSSGSSAPQPRARRPPSARASALARPFAAALGSLRSTSPQRAAPCTPHRSHKTSAHTTPAQRAAPNRFMRASRRHCHPRPHSTRCSHRVDAQTAHWQVFGRHVPFP